MLRRHGLLIFTIVLLSFNGVWASGDSSRAMHRFGIYGTLLGDPFPSLAGINLALNAAEFLRFNVGYGQVTGSASTSNGGTTTLTATTLGAGGKLFVPGWNLSPMLGFNWSQVSISSSSSATTTGTVDGFNSSGTTLYYTVGIDWQGAGGFDFAVGYNQSTTAGVGGLPFAQLGYFF